MTGNQVHGPVRQEQGGSTHDPAAQGLEGEAAHAALTPVTTTQHHKMTDAY